MPEQVKRSLLSRLWGLRTYNMLKPVQQNACIFFKIGLRTDQNAIGGQSFMVASKTPPRWLRVYMETQRSRFFRFTSDSCTDFR